MRLVALVLLCMVVVVHHGVPALGHEAHAAAGQSTGAPGHADHDAPDDAGLLMGTCLAVLVAAGLAVATVAARRLFILRRASLLAARPSVRMLVGPPSHGPPRPTRPCVLLR